MAKNIMIMLYIFVFFMISLFLFLRNQNSIKLTLHGHQISVYIDSVIVIALLLLLQFVVQSEEIDYYAYKGFFEAVEPISEVLKGNNTNFVSYPTYFDIGYKYLNSIFKQICDNAAIFFTLINLLSLLIILKFFRKNIVNIYVIMLPYFAFMYISLQLGLIRQAIANVIFIISIKYLERNDAIKFFAVIFIAALFHITAALLLLLYFIVRRSYKVNLLVVIFILFTLLYVLKIDIFFHILNLVLHINSTVQNKILFYLDNSVLNNYLGIGFWDRLIMFFILIRVRLCLVNRNIYTNFLNICFNLAILNIFIQMIAFDYAMLTTRFRYYFILFPFFIIGQYLHVMGNHNNKVLIKLCLVMYCFLMFFMKIFMD